MQNSSVRGSAEVEAALIIPLAVLVIAGMIKLGTQLFDRTVESSLKNTQAAAELVEGGKLSTESILRGRWYLK